MIIKIAQNIGFCFGVRRAVELSQKLAKEYKKTIYTYGELIHNSDVVNKLKSEDDIVVETDYNKLHKGDILVIRSHGASNDVITNCTNAGIKIIDATCPFVKNIHEIVKRECNNRQIIIVGKKDHPEVIGIVSNCSDYAVVNSVSDLYSLDFKEKVCIVAQTTSNVNSFYEIAQEVSKKVHDLLIYDTTCKTTRQRQQEAKELSSTCSVMFVIGDKNSSNTCKLVDICKQNCNNVYLIENSVFIPKNELNSKSVIGIVAGASTPDWVIKEVVDELENINKSQNC